MIVAIFVSVYFLIIFPIFLRIDVSVNLIDFSVKVKISHLFIDIVILDVYFYGGKIKFLINGKEKQLKIKDFVGKKMSIDYGVLNVYSSFELNKEKSLFSKVVFVFFIKYLFGFIYYFFINKNNNILKKENGEIIEKENTLKIFFSVKIFINILSVLFSAIMFLFRRKNVK